MRHPKCIQTHALSWFLTHKMGGGCEILIFNPVGSEGSCYTVMLLGYFWNLLDVFLFRGLDSTHEVDIEEMEERYSCGLISVTVSDKRPSKLCQWIKLPKELLRSQILFSFQLWTPRQNPSHFPSWIWWYCLKTGQKYLSCISACLQWSPTQEVA